MPMCCLLAAGEQRIAFLTLSSTQEEGVRQLQTAFMASHVTALLSVRLTKDYAGAC